MRESSSLCCNLGVKKEAIYSPNKGGRYTANGQEKDHQHGRHAGPGVITTSMIWK